MYLAEAVGESFLREGAFPATLENGNILESLEKSVMFKGQID